MRITVLKVPDCPYAPVAQERIAAALDGRTVRMELVEVRAEADATRWGMTGSPTVLIDGVDPFAVAGTAPSVSCRLYKDADGRMDGAPSADALRHALTGTRARERGPRPAAGVSDAGRRPASGSAHRPVRRHPEPPESG